MVVEDARPAVVGVEDNCALADVDIAEVTAIAVVIAAIVGGLAAVQSATGRLEQGHGEGLVEQSCGFR